MFHAQDRKYKREFFEQRTVTRILAIFSLIAAGVLVLAAAPGSVSAGANRTERRNQRIRVSVAAANAKAMAFPLPFAAIDVDRIDDDATASACTAAANDCSLRGAVAFANLNPGTTINVPAGTYQLNIPGGIGEGFTGNNSIGDLDIRADDTIIAGAGAATTIIQQTQPNDRVIEVNPDLLANFDFSISGVTITGGNGTTAVGGGVSTSMASFASLSKQVSIGPSFSWGRGGLARQSCSFRRSST